MEYNFSPMIQNTSGHSYGYQPMRNNSTQLLQQQQPGSGAVAGNSVSPLLQQQQSAGAAVAASNAAAQNLMLQSLHRNERPMENIGDHQMTTNNWNQQSNYAPPSVPNEHKNLSYYYPSLYNGSIHNNNFNNNTADENDFKNRSLVCGPTKTANNSPPTYSGGGNFGTHPNKTASSSRFAQKSKIVCPPPGDEVRKPCPGECAVDCRVQPICHTPNPCGPCIKPTEIEWSQREFVCNESGVGWMPKQTAGIGISAGRKYCCTPLTQYMNVHGELAKKLLTHEICLNPGTLSAPPCNLCEDVMPLCRGYYRPGECAAPDEYNHMTCKDGQPMLRSKVERYWNPCRDLQNEQHIADLAGHNVGLLNRLRKRKHGGEVCW